MAVNAPNHAPTAANVTVATAPTVAINATAGNLNGTYFYKVTFVSPAGETPAGTASASVAPVSQQANLTAIPLGPAGTTARRIYRAKTLVGNTYGLVGTIADNTTTILTDNATDATQTGGVAPPVGNLTGSYIYALTNYSPSFGESPIGLLSGTVTPSGQAVLITNIKDLPANVSERRLYRSKNGSVFQRVAIFTVNPVSYQDNLLDSGVVGAAPIGQIVAPFIASSVIRRRSPGEPVALFGILEIRGQSFTQKNIKRRASIAGGTKSLG